MSQATRFLGLVLAGWVGLRLVGSGLSGAPSLAAPQAQASAADPIAAASPAPPGAVAPPPGERLSLPAPLSPALPAALPAGAVLTPYGYLIPFAPAGAPLAPPSAAAAVPAPMHGGGGAASWRGAAARPASARAPAVALDPALAGYTLTPGARPAAATPAPAAAAGAAVPPPVWNTPAARGTPAPSPPLDRWQLSLWSLAREPLADAPGLAPGLAPGSSLGGDQAGARLIYNHDRRFGLAARFSTATGSVRGDEVALGLRLRPVPALPIAITAERRERIGDGAGARSAFALFAEGGVAARPLGLGLSLDAYAQAGVVGLGTRDWFVDGAATASRPLWRGLRLGAGVWGAAQPGLERVDVGPRVSLPAWHGVRLHADYRQQVLGNARPGSGPVLTLAANF
ncbi:hypothetical protein [Sphingomicrobium astaxanthinifaciens]|uniref:hypothetical protein n=1 Tax=Sphingomicrobium astaxanthinifaciens TaxID=1227949 RepID=UPI001FCB0502|nr:hypothetical protein [Sphingomicrobium astaxanthinifaciens]MCJ7421275.1 hypothetical protein [Sphingomicrobium astaxanthinifaciens]